ncbi:MAG TPA: carbamoyltransferase [Vicinamibacterales bacterium]|nr:carbamoyltransferase [Vicinamibacterales bacterium]
MPNDSPTYVLGLSAYYHDAAACLLRDGRIVGAAQEERFTRIKHDASFPRHAIDYCLREANIGVRDLAEVVFYEKPLVKFDRLLETAVAMAPKGLRPYLMAMPIWLSEKLWLAKEIQKELESEKPVLFGNHHESHAASAFYPSPFEEAAVLTIDGVGEWATSSIGVGKGSELTLLVETQFPHSLGLLYSAFTYFTGFKVNEGEYKVMGLAPYGEPKYVQQILDELVAIGDDGSIRLNLDYFEFTHGLTMTGDRFAKLFNGPVRKADDPVTQREMDLARSIQVVTEEIMLRMARHAHERTGLDRLCMAGGVALNCVGNGRILREGPFKDIWIQPAAGDAGGALGAAFAVWHRYLQQPRVSAERRGAWVSMSAPATATPPPYDDEMQASLLGPRFSDDDIAAWQRARNLAGERVPRAELARRIAAYLADEKVVGLMQGRMEFGPRALGARSIIGDPRSPTMQSVLNLKIKFRESFRPFAPAVLRERVADWFELDGESPYMLLVAGVRPDKRLPETDADSTLWGIERLHAIRSEIPAVTHVDYSARIQTVRRDANPLYYDIIEAFYERTGCPVIVNTSFNVKDEPIVCGPDEAYACFMKTNMDVLVMESFVFVKDAAAGTAPRAAEAVTAAR